MRYLLALTLLLISFRAGAADPLWNPSEAELSALRQRSVERWQRYFPQGALKPRTTARELIALALDATASGDDPERIAITLRALQSMQDRDPASRHYGNMHWYAGDTQLVDRNGVEFVVRHAGVLWLLYRDRLSSAARKPLQDMLTLAKTGITRHNVAISYTNIFLMKAWNLIALGEGLDDKALAGQGQQMLRDWLAWTSRNGIAEYLSPTYYAVDLECLALIRNLSRDAETRRLAQIGLDAVWGDVALHWYAPAQRLGGTHSRDYGRLFNSGDINALSMRAGWPADSTRSFNPGPYGAYAWSPPSPNASRWLSAPLPRMLSARWGEAPHQRHHHYLAADFSIASSEAGYHNMDTAPLAVNLGSGNDVPVITWIMDGRRDYFGLARILEAGSGHMKSLHLRPFISSVQRGPEVLMLAHGGQDKTDNTALESTLILPADARYWLDGKPLSLFAHRSQWQFEPAGNGSSTRLDVVTQTGRDVVVLDDRDATLGLGVSRMFAVEAGRSYRLRARLSGGQVSLYLNFFDANGARIGAERIQRVGGQALESEYSFTQMAPPGAVRVRAWLYSPSTSQTKLTLSDLAFERIDEAGATLLGGYDFRSFQPQQVRVPAGSTLIVQRESAALALQLIAARDVDGHPIDFTLHNDGLLHGALRLTAVHADARSNGMGSMALWAMARGGLDEAKATAFRAEAARMRSSFELVSGVMDVSASIGAATPLRLRADLVRSLRLLREGGDTMPTDSARALNGQDLGFGTP